MIFILSFIQILNTHAKILMLDNLIFSNDFCVYDYDDGDDDRIYGKFPLFLHNTIHLDHFFEI